MKTYSSSGLMAKTRENLARVLNHALQEELALSATMRDFLGSVTGPHFHSLYRLFGDHCRQIDRWLGELGERAQALGAVLRGGVEELGHAAPGTAAGRPTRSMLGDLLGLHEAIANRLRTDLAACSGDAATADFVKRLVEFHETTAWMLRMVLQGPDVPAAGA